VVALGNLITRCSANVSFLFPDRSLDAALTAAAAAGFGTVELLDPYHLPPQSLKTLLECHGLSVDLINAPFGDFAAGERGLAGDPTRRQEFRKALDLAEELASEVEPAKVNILAGCRTDAPLAAQMDCLLENLDRAAARFAPARIRVVTELLNPIETPGFLLRDLDTVESILDQLDDRVGFQLDIYQLQRTSGNLIPSIHRLAKRTWHVQVADAPRRSEPGTGEINVPNVLAAVRAASYNGIVGLEYSPISPSDPFAWMAEAGCAKA
jgi:hydroxypyruvate isomerase